jgi:hypothetical protein
LTNIGKTQVNINPWKPWVNYSRDDDWLFSVREQGSESPWEYHCETTVKCGGFFVFASCGFSVRSGPEKSRASLGYPMEPGRAHGTASIAITVKMLVERNLFADRGSRMAFLRFVRQLSLVYQALPIPRLPYWTATSDSAG